MIEHWRCAVSETVSHVRKDDILIYVHEYPNIIADDTSRQVHMKKRWDDTAHEMTVKVFTIKSQASASTHEYAYAECGA